MLCKKMIIQKNRTFLYCKRDIQITSLTNIRNIFSTTCNPLRKLEQSGRSGVIINYTSNRARTQNKTGCFASESSTGILKGCSLYNLKVKSRFLHSLTSLLTLQNGGISVHCRHKTSDVGQNSKLQKMPGVSVNIDEVLRHSFPASVETNKIPVIYYDDCTEASQIFHWNPLLDVLLKRAFDGLTDESIDMPHNFTLKYVFEKLNRQWVCSYHMLWPVEVKFSATDRSKTVARNKTSATVLLWLRNFSTIKKGIDQNNPETPEINNVRNKPVVVKIVFYQDDESTRQILKLYPSPKNVLHNLFDDVVRKLDNKSLKINPQYRLIKDGKQSVWMCTYHALWPEEVKFRANDAKKSLASHKAAIAALDWLKANKKITDEGSALIYGKEEVKKVTKKTLSVYKFNETMIDMMEKIIRLHRTEIVPHIVQDMLQKTENEDQAEEEFDVVSEPGEVNFKKVRRQKYLGLERYLAREKVELPIAAYKDNFIQLLKDNQVVIVKGEPGCGKSTRVPQYVLEAWAKEEGLLGEPGRVAVTQPRRIAAISLAERVAVERDEAVGSIVGYQVRLKSNFNSATGKILYCTTGILLRHFQSDPNLSSFSHVILDEAHERDVNTDLLMNLLRSACKANPNLKLIVMSATIDTTMFSEYFGGAPVMDIPGFTYPVTQHFLESSSKIDLSKTLEMCEGNVPTVIHQDVARTIQFIHQNKNEGAILCFLPGWEDINKVQKLIPQMGDLAVYCLHSRLQDSDQWKIFSRPPPGVRKVILATNIAETSVTIDDVVYVIDTGIHKEQRFDIEKGVNCIDNHWVSKASASQRKGRAGRVQPGHCYHLYTREKYDSFVDYSLPEILRTSLTKIVLDSKVFSNNMNAVEFMSQLPTPPEENATLRAVEELKDLEMLDREENLTSLGTTCADFQLEPKLSKALINAVIFKCVTPVVDIITLFSSDTEFFASGLTVRDQVRMAKSQFSKTSDHLAMMRLFEKWLEYSEDGQFDTMRRFCDKTNLVPYRMETIAKLRKIHYDYFNNLYDILPISDDFSDNDEMVKAVLYSGVGTVLKHRTWDIVKQKLKNNVHCLLTRNDHKATITTESVNHKRSNFPTDFLLYINETRSNIRRTTLVRECSLIPTVSVVLFSNKDLVVSDVDVEHLTQDIESKDLVKISIENTNITFACEKSQSEVLVNCNYAINAACRYYIRQLTSTGICNEEVNTAWDSILALINDILNQSSVKS